MITSVSGLLVSSSPLLVVIEAGGLGYEVNVPLTTAERLPPPGERIKLHTLAVYREDAQTLYGFPSVEERDFFRTMVEKVTGVGPKLALSVMSRLSLPTLRGAIAAGDVGLLAKCPGIGRKTAERLVMELRDKVAPGTASGSAGATVAATGAHPAEDAVLALVALGYKAPDADKAVRQAAAALGAEASVEALIKKALG